MRSFWKIVLLAAIPIGGYWLYKKSREPSDVDLQSGPTEDGKPPRSSPSRTKGGADAKQTEVKKDADEQVIERLTAIDGVTSRVAENLVQRGIYTKEELTSLSREELMEIKGIGPKRAEEILKL